MRTIVTTESVARADRFEHWDHEMSQFFTGLDTRPVTRSPFRGHAAIDSLGLLHLTSISSVPQRVSHTVRPTARHEEDFIQSRPSDRGHLHPAHAAAAADAARAPR